MISDINNARLVASISNMGQVKFERARVHLISQAERSNPSVDGNDKNVRSSRGENSRCAQRYHGVARAMEDDANGDISGRI